jgi:hypothetical protein
MDFLDTSIVLYEFCIIILSVRFIDANLVGVEGTIMIAASVLCAVFSHIDAKLVGVEGTMIAASVLCAVFSHPKQVLH